MKRGQILLRRQAVKNSIRSSVFCQFFRIFKGFLKPWDSATRQSPTQSGHADAGPTTTATETGGGVYPEINSRRTTTETETAAARQSPTQSGHADAGPTTTATEAGGGVYPEINSRRTTTETSATRQSPTQSGHADAGPTTTATETGGGVYPGPSALTRAFAPPPMPGADGADGASADEGTARRGTSEHHGPTTTPAETGIEGVDTGGATAEAGATTARRSSTQSGLSFRFADTDKRFPPPSSNDVELKLKKLKEEVVKTYKNHTISKYNVSDGERQFLTTLKKNEDVVIKQSDKCKGFVIMDKNMYLEKAQDILGDPRNYEKLDKNTVPKVEAQTKRVFKSVSKDKLDEKTSGS